MSDSVETERLMLRQVKSFLSGSDLKAAIYLLRNIPSTKAAVFEFLEAVFDDGVKAYRDNQDTFSTSECSSTLQELHGILYGFIRSNPTAWAPFISFWSLRLLGVLSKKYGNDIKASCGDNLLEVIQMWFGCPVMRFLIDITSFCVSQLVNINPDLCIDSLLETSVQYSPHFDWVVAHIGSCFPHTVITRVLFCGLKDFLQQDDACLAVSSGRASKLSSVVGILGHLAGHHSSDIRRALVTIIHQGLLLNDSSAQQCEPFVAQLCLDEKDEEKKRVLREKLAAVPYLLQLTRMSELLLTSLLAEHTLLLSVEVMNRLSEVIPLWKKYQIPGSGNLEDDLVAVLLCCGQAEHHSARTLILTMLSIASRQGPTGCKDEVCAAVGSILDRLLMEIERCVYQGNQRCLLLNALVGRLSDINWLFCSRDPIAYQWCIELAALICIQSNERTRILANLLCLTDSPDIFKHVVKLVECSHGNILSDTLCCLMAELKSGRISQPKRLVMNLTQLASEDTLGKRVIDVLSRYGETLAKQAVSAGEAADAAAFIRLLALTFRRSALSLAAHFRVVSANVTHFFCLVQPTKDTCSDLIADSAAVKEQYIGYCLDLFEAISVDSNARDMALRALLEGALSDEVSECFGAVKLPSATSTIAPAFVSLLKENRKFATSITFPQSHSSIMRVGVIGNGLRHSNVVPRTSKDQAFVNRQYLHEAIRRCCGDSLEGLRTVALLLVELISSDVMYNDLKWPDEEFAKTTIERDLRIKAMFSQHPIITDLIYLLATRSPSSLCLCSVLLRAVMAVQLRHWRNSLDLRVTQNHIEMAITRNILEIMGLSQLIPPPLSLVPMVVEFFSPHDFACVLEDIWAFMAKHVTTPDCFDEREVRIKKFELPLNHRYTERLRMCLIKSIDKCGPLFAYLFNPSTISAA